MAESVEATEAHSTAVLQIVAGLTHDLKTPLHAMLSLVSVLLREIDGPLNDEQRRQVAGVKRNGEHLLALINQLLESSSLVVRSTQPRIELFDVAALCAELVSIHLPLAEERGLSLHCDTSAVRGEFASDRTFLRQILGNLLGNALKFTERGGEVTLRAGSRAEQLWIDVVDTGQGIRWSEQGRVLEPLSQGGVAGVAAAVSAEELKGIGLGLSLVREGIRLLGGSLEVKSEAGKGTLVSVSLVAKPISSAPIQLAIMEDDESLSAVVREVARHCSVPFVVQLTAPNLLTLANPSANLAGAAGGNINQPQILIISERRLEALSSTERTLLLDAVSKGEQACLITFDGSASGRARIRAYSGCRHLGKPYNVEELRRNMLEMAQEFKSPKRAS